MRPLQLAEKPHRGRLSSNFFGSNRRIKTDEPFLSLIAETGFLHGPFKFKKENLRLVHEIKTVRLVQVSTLCFFYWTARTSNP